MLEPGDLDLDCAAYATGRMLALFDDIRLSDKPHPWYPTFLVWDRVDGTPENYRCLSVLVRSGTYSRWVEQCRYELAARWLAASNPHEALALTATEAPTVIGGHATTIMVVRVRYTGRAIAPEGVVAEVPYRVTEPLDPDMDLVWLAYPKDNGHLVQRTLTQTVRPRLRRRGAPSDDALADACLQTWYEDPL